MTAATFAHDHEPHRSGKLIYLDRGLAWLLILSACLHSYGAYLGYGFMTPAQFWAWVASVAIVLIAALSLLRVNRPGDRGIAWVAFAGSVAWTFAALVFGAVLMGYILDPRALINAIEAAALAAFSLRDALGLR